MMRRLLCLMKESPALSPIKRAWSVTNKGYVDLNTACVGYQSIPETIVSTAAAKRCSSAVLKIYTYLVLRCLDFFSKCFPVF